MGVGTRAKEEERNREKGTEGMDDPARTGACAPSQVITGPSIETARLPHAEPRQARPLILCLRCALGYVLVAPPPAARSLSVSLSLSRARALSLSVCLLIYTDTRHHQYVVPSLCCGRSPGPGSRLSYVSSGLRRGMDLLIAIGSVRA